VTIALSNEIRAKLDVHDGDEFEAQVFNSSVIWGRKNRESN